MNDNAGVKTHLSMPDRHIRAVEIGDVFDFAGRTRVLKEIKRTRNGGKTYTFEDGYMIDANLPQYDDVTVNVTRAKRKLQGMGVQMQDRSHAR